MRVLSVVLALLILLYFSLQICYAFKWKPANLTDKQLQELIKNDKPDEIKVTFWQLPWWIKLHYILTTILGILGIWKFLPIVVTKVKSALENAKRRKILRVVMKNPGISLKELEDITGMNRSTLRFHIDFLEKEGWVRSVRVGKHRLLFANGQDVHVDIKSERKRRIIELLSGRDGLSIKELANLLGVSYHTAYRHVMDLKEWGIVAVENGSVRLVRR